MPPTVATAAIGAVGVWSVFVTLGLPVFGIFALWASGPIDVSSYIKYAVIGLAVLLAMIVVFALIMRSEPLAIRIGGWATSSRTRSSPASSAVRSTSSRPS